MPTNHALPRARRALLALLGLSLAACSDDSPATSPADASLAGYGPGAARIYGAPVTLGAGRARSYVIVDQKNGDTPLEVGVAFDEGALNALPAPMGNMGGDMAGHADMHEYLLAMPAQNATPFKFVELDWNPGGHEP